MKKHFIVAYACAALLGASGDVYARWVAFKNATPDKAVQVEWKNARTNAATSVEPGKTGIVEVKPDKLWGSHYAVRDNDVYVKVNGKALSPADAQKVNEYVKKLWDDDSKKEPEKYALVLYYADVPGTDETELAIAVPRAEIKGFFGKAGEWVSEHQSEIAAGAATAAVAGAGAGVYLATQGEEEDTKGAPKSEEEKKEEIIIKSLAVLDLQPQQRDRDVVKGQYRKLAFQYHPDKTARLPEDERREAEDKLKAVNYAWENLEYYLFETKPTPPLPGGW